MGGEEHVVSGPGHEGRAAPRAGAVRRWRLAVLAFLLAVHATLAWMAREPGILTGQDDAEYITLAKSLRQGGYNELFRVDTPLHAQYPPAYPAALAAWGAVFGDGFDALVALNVLLSVASLGLLFRILAASLGETVGFLAVAVLAVNPEVVRFSGLVMSEIPYLFLTLVVLALLAREEAGRPAVAATIAAAVLAALTRTAGVTLVAALGLYWLVKARRRAAVPLAVSAIVVLGGWMLWTMLAPEKYVGASYVADFGAGPGRPWVYPLPERIPQHILWYWRAALPWMLAVPTIAGTPIDNAIGVLVIALTAGAGLFVFARRWRAGLAYALCYGGLLSVWVWRVDRFLVPVLFLVVAAMLAGSVALAAGRRGGSRHALAIGLALILIGGGGARSVRLAADRASCHGTGDLPPAGCLAPDQASWFEAVRWVRANTGPDAVLLLAKPAPFWLYTGRRGVGYEPALAQSDSAFLPFLRDHGAEYVLLGSLHFKEPQRLLELVRANCAGLDVAAWFPPRTWLFSLRPPGTGDPAGRACQAAAEYAEANRDRVAELTR